jgi:hypothetical protein
LSLVDCTQQRALCDRLQVVAFPAVMMLDGSDLYSWQVCMHACVRMSGSVSLPCQGERSHDALAEWALGGYKKATATKLQPRGSKVCAYVLARAMLSAFAQAPAAAAAAAANAAYEAGAGAAATAAPAGPVDDTDVIVVTDAVRDDTMCASGGV